MWPFVGPDNTHSPSFQQAQLGLPRIYVIAES
jgi:hypothetical protein